MAGLYLLAFRFYALLVGLGLASSMTNKAIWHAMVFLCPLGRAGVSKATKTVITHLNKGFYALLVGLGLARGRRVVGVLTCGNGTGLRGPCQ
jgi:hypothetical protein